MTRVQPWRVYTALCLASVLWGSLYTAAKPAVADVGAFQVTLCRVVLACLSLTPLVLGRGGTPLLRKTLRAHWRGIALLGLLNFAASQMLALSALNFLPASVNGVLNNMHPLWVAIGTAFFFTPPRPRLLILGSFVALVGVALVFLPDLVQAGGNVTPVGVSLALAGSGVIAIGTVIGRRVMQDSDPLAVSALASAAAIAPVALIATASGGLQPIAQASLEIKMLLIYVGVGCTAMNFALWYYGLKYLPAASASAFQYLIAPIGVALAAVFLHEPVAPTLVVGTVCVILGLAVTQRSLLG